MSRSDQYRRSTTAPTEEPPSPHELLSLKQPVTTSLRSSAKPRTSKLCYTRYGLPYSVRTRGYDEEATKGVQGGRLNTRCLVTRDCQGLRRWRGVPRTNPSQDSPPVSQSYRNSQCSKYADDPVALFLFTKLTNKWSVCFMAKPGRRRPLVGGIGVYPR